jgi:hypothetical protein
MSLFIDHFTIQTTQGRYRLYDPEIPLCLSTCISLNPCRLPINPVLGDRAELSQIVVW